jgi:hypothetical protein
MIVFLLFTLVHSFLFSTSPEIFIMYCVIAPLLIVVLAQSSPHFIVYPLGGFLISALIQSIIHPNSRYIVAAGCMGAIVWAVSYLCASWVLRAL